MTVINIHLIRTDPLIFKNIYGKIVSAAAAESEAIAAAHGANALETNVIAHAYESAQASLLLPGGLGDLLAEFAGALKEFPPVILGHDNPDTGKDLYNNEVGRRIGGAGH